jgi:hypothetical protein
MILLRSDSLILLPCPFRKHRSYTTERILMQSCRKNVELEASNAGVDAILPIPFATKENFAVGEKQHDIHELTSVCFY